MTTRIKKWILSGGMLSFLIFLAGCMRIDQDTGEPAGAFSQLMYDYLVIPTQQVLEWLAGTIGSFGLAIIALTIIIRVLILPLGMKQQRSMMEQQIKMSTIKPATDEIQAEMKETDDPTEKQELQSELMELYRENDISMLGQITGCFPLLIQMPIFIAMLYAIRQSEAIANATWLGISLGETSIILGILTGVIYYIQSKLMQVGMPEEQRKQGGAMTLMTPVMMLFMSITGPAGLALYWFAGGFVAIGQSLLTNLYYKPKIEAELKEKHGDKETVERKKPPKKKETADEGTSTVTPAPSAKDRRRSNSPFESKGRRNEGKQQHSR